VSPATGRRIHLALLTLWTVVGIPVSWYLKESVPWLVFLSVYAIIVSHAAGWSAERPTEIADEDDPEQ
jgi:predicted alpha/beta hydrolase